MFHILGIPRIIFHILQRLGFFPLKLQQTPSIKQQKCPLQFPKLCFGMIINKAGTGNLSPPSPEIPDVVSWPFIHHQMTLHRRHGMLRKCAEHTSLLRH